MKTMYNHLTWKIDQARVIIFLLVFFTLIFSGCRRQNDTDDNGVKAVQQQFSRSNRSTADDIEMASLLRSLDELAELERAGSWFQGMALTECGIRENMGDYEGAVAAAYKELSWAYGLGLLSKNEIEKSILNLISVRNEEPVASAAGAILAFSRGQWSNAADDLRPLFSELDEPDGFARWMILVCDLEKNESSVTETRRAAAAYKSIRARYVQFPEYWYRGARAFSGLIAADYAENCINLSPQGPFAQECRLILAAHSGLKAEDSLSIKTMKEIETIISQSVNSGNPQILYTLFPLISLPENPYTVYAVSSLRTLTGVPGFRDYFSGQAASAEGRLAERLSYICLG